MPGKDPGHPRYRDLRHVSMTEPARIPGGIVLLPGPGRDDLLPGRSRAFCAAQSRDLSRSQFW